MLPVTDLVLRSTARWNAPTLVLLHFFGGSRREWIETSLLLGNGFRVLSIDAPGFGEADGVPGYSVAEMAGSIRDTMSQLSLGSFVLVGHSMTGKVAAVLAHVGLPGLQKLVLVAPSPLSPEPISDENRAAMLAETAPTREHAEKYIHANSHLPLPPDVFERAVEDRMRANPAAWQAWLEDGSREDWSERIPMLDLPTLVIAAQADTSLGPAVQEKLTLPRLRNGSMSVIPGSGHLIPMEAPERLSVLISDFAMRSH